MNGYSNDRELPELSNDQIETLYQICVAAAKSQYPPIKALFTEYDAYVVQQGLEPGQENALFRWICSVGDGTRKQHVAGERIDLIRSLRSVLAAHGIETVLEDEESEEETRSLRVSNTPPKKKDSKPSRRVSFGDAQVEETWLSERSQFTDHRPPPAQAGLLSQPPLRGRDHASTQRARSTSSSRYSRRPEPNGKQNGSPSSRYDSAAGHQENPTLVFEVSQTQLEQNAEAFYATTELRSARHYLHMWHDQALALQSSRNQAWSFAENHDRRKLLKESLDALVTACATRKEEKARIFEIQRLERLEQEREEKRILKLGTILEEKQRKKDNDILYKAFSHWAESNRYQKQIQEGVKRRILKIRYFRRWRRIAVENATKARSILTKKYVQIWRDRTARQALMHEQAEAHYEETLMKRSFQRWLWEFCSRRVEGWHENKLLQRTFNTWKDRLQSLRNPNLDADEVRGSELKSNAFSLLVQRYRARQDASASAEAHYRQNLATTCLRSLKVRAKLTPREKSVSLKVTLDLKRKAFKVWHLNLTLTRQAAEVDRKRILQSAWTSWNDTLRCKALGQRIDERVVVESLYKWVLQARLQSFRRSQNGKLLRRVLNDLDNKCREKTLALEQASIAFAANQRSRELRSCMVRLNMALRDREDADRAAIEFANSRAIPNVIDVWKERTEHARMLAKWAADARFYYLTTRTLKVWRERTEQHKHQRRRDAYVQVRTAVKVRLVKRCFATWQAKAASITAMNAEATTRAQDRVFKIGMDGFNKLRDKAAEYSELHVQATAMDHQKLLGSALSALINERSDLEVLMQQALEFRQESDLALLASALKRLQWVTFTAARRAESADALWARNRDQHIRNMLRHWASQASARRTAKRESAQRDPESPSLRPASRVTARSAQRPTFPSSPPAPTATPAYMRTPSRSRRPGRFRPLPTPAHVTPMAFEQSFFATTPAPLLNVRPEEQAAETNDVFEGLTPQITPFARKLRASGVTPVPPSALKSSVFGRSVTGAGTNKSVRFAGSSRFGGGRRLSPPDEST